mmetsp:Transcript_7746/g.22766  ORF Transcript_7746/g.22766 Transcript_7746/m.22766 type:complete len:256 (-) Transcript_7746:409-1176(-)
MYAKVLGRLARVRRTPVGPPLGPAAHAKALAQYLDPLQQFHPSREYVSHPSRLGEITSGRRVDVQVALAGAEAEDIPFVDVPPRNDLAEEIVECSIGVGDEDGALGGEGTVQVGDDLDGDVRLACSGRSDDEGESRRQPAPNGCDLSRCEPDRIARMIGRERVRCRLHPGPSSFVGAGAGAVDGLPRHPNLVLHPLHPIRTILGRRRAANLLPPVHVHFAPPKASPQMILVEERVPVIQRYARPGHPRGPRCVIP